MKYEELKSKLPIVGYNMISGNFAPRSHYKFLMSLGRVWPCCTAQVKAWEALDCRLDVMNGDDAARCEELMNRHGFSGDYRLTRSARFARLANTNELLAAFKKEYGV